MSGPEAILVPVKSFGAAKGRLAGVLGKDRERLARQWAAGVIEAGAPHDVIVTCEDDDVASWAKSLGARVIQSAAKGLNDAVASASRELADDRYSRITVAHADLPLPASLAGIGQKALHEGAVIVPDTDHDGTNVLSLPGTVLTSHCARTFAFFYGPGSYLRHLANATDMGLSPVVVEDPYLALDIDNGKDLEALQEHHDEYRRSQAVS